MAMSAARFNCIQPGLEPSEMSARYRAFVDMAAHAEANGFSMITLEEHHGADNGWSPSPLIMAGLVFGRTQQIGVSISALLLPLHDPLRVAEDIAVLDHASGGRLTTIVGLGYRPSEYAAHGKDWAARGALMDESVDVLLTAWTGEPFEYRGTTVRVTPRPLTQPHPMVLLGGTSKPAARRAARHGLPMFAAAHLPWLEAYYYEQCAEHGTQGFYMMPGEDTAMIHVAEDPDRAWAELGRYFMEEAATYASWQTPDISSAMHSHARTPEDLRAEGIYQVCTPDELVERLTAQGPGAFVTLHPLVGGMPIDEGWKSLQLYTDAVLPRLG
ncbi:MAG: LLM class flavin-dependent oxidoreductase [Actinobacteria bacterium]|nr:LLM class flavin-dependent oxidoreductase [Actinomycetota bacterium]MBM3698152.1 LLM class flavin-dependent oxidoreductase [Actinomycetota bacterium]